MNLGKAGHYSKRTETETTFRIAIKIKRESERERERERDGVRGEGRECVGACLCERHAINVEKSSKLIMYVLHAINQTCYNELYYYVLCAWCMQG